jgi:hypothetical protein
MSSRRIKLASDFKRGTLASIRDKKKTKERQYVRACLTREKIINCNVNPTTTTTKENETDTDTESETTIVTPTKE